MNLQEEVTLLRDCEAVEVPGGFRIVVPVGTHGYIAHSLGGNFTVITDFGNMVQIAGKDADAIGKERPAAPASSSPAPGAVPGQVDQKAVWDMMRTVYDPEIPIDIVELGLIYKCEITPGPEGAKVFIRLTMTAPGCGMGDIIKSEIESKVGGLPGVSEVEVEVVFDPPWDREMMSEAARLQLGLM